MSCEAKGKTRKEERRMTENGESAEDGGQVDLAGLLAKVEQAESILGEIRREIGVLAGRPESVDELVAKVESTPSSSTPSASRPSAEAKAGGYRAPIEKLFLLAAAQPMEADDLEASLSEILHSSARSTPRSVKMLVRFPWKRFMKSWTDYLGDEGDSNSFEVVRTSPRDIGAALRIKVFLAVTGKHPSPVELARDEGDDSPWGIISFSL